MKDMFGAEHFAANARRHRACAKLSKTPDIVAFHNELADRLEKLAEDCRTLYDVPGRLRR